MMNRIEQKLSQKKKVLSIYMTAGYPNLDDTVKIISSLQEAGVDMIEIGLPYSDPIADGKVIQDSSSKAIENGMTADLLFQQLTAIREHVKIPLLIMTYYNLVMQYGLEKFCKRCQNVGIDGLIIPDLPIEWYVEKCKSTFDQYQLQNVFLITPQTDDERIKQIDNLSSKSFIYVVSSFGVTGGKKDINQQQMEYFLRIEQLQLKSPKIIGFGIHNAETFQKATQYTDGAIIGSAFIKHIAKNGIESLDKFIKEII